MNTEEIRTQVCNYIWNLGCPNCYNGYNYLRDGICRAIEYPNEIGCLKKSIYFPVAKKYGTDTSNVERCIRTIVERWWMTNNCGSWFSSKPTNRQVLSTLAERIRVEYGLF